MQTFLKLKGSGDSHSMALTLDGTVYTWGCSGTSATGHESANNQDRSTPHPPRTLKVILSPQKTW
jgi:alpha-tubulin suppressor-like RCC1 family protein